MEEVLDVYMRPYDPRYPQVCLDETSKQLVSETRVPIPAEPGRSERFDYEYERQGVCSLFMCFEPLMGWRHVTVSAHRTKQDFAQVLRDLVDVRYPDVEKIVLVLDNLNTHDFSALYETFEPEEAWRIREKIEIHHTPKHGSWLNMAEIELAVLSGQWRDATHWGGDAAPARGSRLGSRAQCTTCQGELAFYHAERSYQAQASLSRPAERIVRLGESLSLKSLRLPTRKEYSLRRQSDGHLALWLKMSRSMWYRLSPSKH